MSNNKVTIYHTELFEYIKDAVGDKRSFGVFRDVCRILAKFNQCDSQAFIEMSKLTDKELTESI